MSEFTIPDHLRRVEKFKVTEEHSAAHLGSGSVNVLSTPSMILFMEIAARNALEEILPEELSSVGVAVDIKHRKAVKIGTTVSSEVEVINIDRKKITFSVVVRHDEDILGDGTHTRFIIEKSKFFKNL